MGKPADLLQGTLDMLILKAVSLGALHGYGVLLANPADLERPSRNPAGLPLSGAVPARASGAHRERVGRVREQAQGEVLPAHAVGASPASGVRAELEPDDRHHRPHPQHGAGEV